MLIMSQHREDYQGEYFVACNSIVSEPGELSHLAILTAQSILSSKRSCRRIPIGYIHVVPVNSTTMGNILWSILWALLLIFIGWPVAFFMAWFYIICMPFAACIDPCKSLVEFFEKVVKLPNYFAEKISGGEEMCWRKPTPLSTLKTVS